MTFTILTIINDRGDPLRFWQHTLQVPDCSMFEAIDKWSIAIIDTKILGNMDQAKLLGRIVNLSEVEGIKNVWKFSMIHKVNNNISVTLIKTSEEVEMKIDCNERNEFIFSELNQDFNGQYSIKDVELILDLKFEFLKETGLAITKYNYTRIMDHNIDDETDTKMVAYIHKKALHIRKTRFHDDFIEDVLDLEFVYLENRGLISDPKLKLYGLEFNQPREN